MKHYLITRYNINLYTGNVSGVKNIDKWMMERVDLFERTKESVMSQDVEFEWWVLIDPKTPSYYRNLIDTDERIKLVEHVGVAKTLVFPEGWKITTRIDSDDVYYEGALKAIQQRATHNEMVIDIDYEMVYSDHTVSSRRVRANSMFASLVNKNPNKCVHDGMHSDLDKIYHAVKIKKVLAGHIMHGNNLMKKKGDNWL